MEKKDKDEYIRGTTGSKASRGEIDISRQADIMIPDVLHFTVINLGAFAATQVVDKRIISIPLTQAQRLDFAQMKTIDEKFFDVAYTISRYEGENN